eukprot:g966.t1
MAKRKCPPSPEWNLHARVAPLMPALPGMCQGAARGARTTRSRHKKARADGAQTALELYELCLAMRRGDGLGIRETYVRWRCVEQWANMQTSAHASLRGRVPRMILPTEYAAGWPDLLARATALAQDTWAATRHLNEASNRKKQSATLAVKPASTVRDALCDENQLSACVLFLDDYQESNIGIYEPHGCAWLDQHHPDSLAEGFKVRTWYGEGYSPKELKQKRGDVEGRLRAEPYPYEWAVLYFRQHVVVAHHPSGTSEVTVYNTAGMNFLEDVGNAKLLPFYTRQWQLMTDVLWPSVCAKSPAPTTASSPRGHAIKVVHLGVQGVNDCGIWTWLFPRIHHDSKLHELVDCGNHGIRRARGRAKDKGLDELFQRQVLSVLAEHLGPEEKRKLSEMTASPNPKSGQNNNVEDCAAQERKAAMAQQRNKAKAEKYAEEAQQLGLQVGETRQIPFLIKGEFRLFEGEFKGTDHRGLEFYFEEDDTITRFTKISHLKEIFEHGRALLLAASPEESEAQGGAGPPDTIAETA